MSNVFENKGAMAATIVVAASDSLNKGAANYVCDGVEHELGIDDCETAWNTRQGANVVCTADVDHQVGTFSAKMAVQAGAALGLLATHNFASLDLSAHPTVKLWVKHSLGCAGGDLKLHLSSIADCGGTPNEEEIDLPSLAANVWTQISIPLANPGSDTAIISVGIEMAANDPGAFDLFLDGIKQLWADEVEINQAIDSITKGKVAFLEGLYIIRDKITLKSNIELIGVDGSEFSLNLGEVDILGTEASHLENISVKNIKFSGTPFYQATPSWWDAAIQIAFCDNLEISGCYFDMTTGGAAICPRDGAATTAAKHLRLLNNVVANAPGSYGFQVSHYEDVLIQGNTVENTGVNAIAACYYGSSHVRVIGNRIKSSGHGAISLSPGVNCQVIGNVIENCLTADEGGIELEDKHPQAPYADIGTVYSVVVGNTVRNCNWGIYIRATTYDNKNNIIANNSIEGCAIGIYLKDAHAVDTLVEGNMVLANTVPITDNGTRTTLRDNRGYDEPTRAGELVWKDNGVVVLTDENRTATLDWTTLDLTANTSPVAKWVYLRLQFHVDSINAGGGVTLQCRKNGTGATVIPCLTANSNNIGAGDYAYGNMWVGMDAGQVIEYKINIVGTIQVDTYLSVLAYVE